MREEVVIPNRKDYTLIDRKKPSKEKDEYKPFSAGKDKVPEMANFGTGYHTYVTGLTHAETGLPATDDQKTHHALAVRLSEKIADDREKITMVEKDYKKDSRIAVVSYGITARCAKSAVSMPFPRKEITELAKKVDKIYVPEMNLGQINHVVAEFSKGKCDVISIPKTGGEMHSPKEIVDAVKGGK